MAKYQLLHPEGFTAEDLELMLLYFQPIRPRNDTCYYRARGHFRRCPRKTQIPFESRQLIFVRYMRAVFSYHKSTVNFFLVYSRDQFIRSEFQIGFSFVCWCGVCVCVCVHIKRSSFSVPHSLQTPKPAE